MTKKARATIAGHDMLRAGQRVLVAVSGGADSVALAYVLAELGYPIEIAHFDHETRDGASAADARFVERLANRLNAPYHLER
ncbi:MAG TPA: ATP-binding protein, partial [Candidatus Hydrogenedentes bacterium]|nr:ATP-binding protein [Candidatus Hydrogenedentota bacterium]